jgi:hypothetical protein
MAKTKGYRYGPWDLGLDIVLVLLTGGLWLIWVALRIAKAI